MIVWRRRGAIFQKFTSFMPDSVWDGFLNDFGRLWEPLGGFGPFSTPECFGMLGKALKGLGRLWKVLGRFGMLWEVLGGFGSRCGGFKSLWQVWKALESFSEALKGFGKL